MLTHSDLHCLFEAWDSVLLAVVGDDAWIAGPTGLAHLPLGVARTPAAVSLDAFEPFDELFYLRGLGRFVFATLSENPAGFAVARPDAGELVAEQVLAVPLPDVVTELFVHEDTMFALGTGSPASLTAVVLAGDERAWTATVDTSIAEPAERSVTGIIPSGIVSHIDRTPEVPRWTLSSFDGADVASWESDTWAAVGDQVIWPAEVGGTFGMSVLHDGRQSFYPLPGRLRDMVVVGDVVLGVALIDDADVVVRLHLRAGGGLSCTALASQTSGLKTLHALTQGAAVLQRSALTGPSIGLIDPPYEAVADVRPLGAWPKLNADLSRITSPAGASAIVLTPRQRVRGRVVHFHGGPDAFEVDDLRMMGALRSLAEAGHEIVSINYRGSRGSDLTVQHSAWRRWHETFVEDVQWLAELGLFDQPCVTAGWSFGGSLALIAVTLQSSVCATVVGGTMADLASHRHRATELSSNYRLWFEERFGPPGSNCERFLTLKDQLLRPVPVLSFHGTDDMNCSYADLRSLQAAAVDRGYAWDHLDLPGGAHFVADSMDAVLIHNVTVDFVSRQLTCAGDLPDSRPREGSISVWGRDGATDGRQAGNPASAARRRGR